MSRTLALLENLHVFRGLTKREIAAIAKISVPVSYNAGKTVFVETSKGNDLYVILSGKVKIQHQKLRRTAWSDHLDLVLLSKTINRCSTNKDL